MNSKTISTLPKNDNCCCRIKQLPTLQSQPSLSGKQYADWDMLGAGFIGLAAARQLSILNPRARIILLESQNRGEGSSSRNSGFLVDLILNEGHFSASDI